MLIRTRIAGLFGHQVPRQNLRMTAAIFCAPSATLPTQPVDQLNAEGARLARSSVLTSRINATLPSPRMVAPEMPATRR